MDRQPYSTDLTHAQWALIEPLFPKVDRPDKRNGRPRVSSYRDILNRLFSLNRSGRAWSLMPHDLPPWLLCHNYKIFVWAANHNEREGAKQVLTECKGDYPRLKKLWADGQYTGWLIDWAAQTLGICLEVVLRPDNSDSSFLFRCYSQPIIRSA